MPDLVFIASPHETFTPTQSGALATVIYNTCREAQRDEILPLVVAQHCSAAPYDWPRTLLIEYPQLNTSGPAWWLSRAERKIWGWQHPGQRTYAARIVRALSEKHASTFVILNHPEIAIELRKKFPHSRIFHWFHNQLEAKARVRAKLASSIDGAMAVSQFTSDWVQEHYGLSNDDIRIVPSATDSDHFRPDPGKTARSIPVINFVGRTGIEKAPDLLLRAALLLCEKNIKFELQLVGSNHWDKFELDDYQKELQQLSSQLEERGVLVNFTGHVSREDLPEVLHRADINVVPSRWDEPFGMVTLEGMACGLATVASRTGGTPEVTGGAALLFERDSVEELAAQLEKLIGDEALRAEYSVRGRKRAQQMSWRNTWLKLRAALNI